MQQINMFDILNPKLVCNPLYDSITKDDWVKYTLAKQFEQYINPFILEYVGRFVFYEIEHFEHIRNGLNKEEILEILAQEIYKISLTQCFHSYYENKIIVYSINRIRKFINGVKRKSYNLFIELNDYILIHKDIENLDNTFSFYAMGFKIYDKSNKVYIDDWETREDLLINIFKINEIAELTGEYARFKKPDDVYIRKVGLLNIIDYFKEM